MIMPTTADTTDTTNPTKSDILAPYTTSVNTSLPRESVPNQWFLQGAINLSFTTISLGPYPASTGANIATISMKITITSPHTDNLF